MPRTCQALAHGARYASPASAITTRAAGIYGVIVTAAILDTMIESGMIIILI
jgi:hypothetical protein